MRVLRGPHELEIIPKFNSYRNSPAGIEFRKHLKPQFNGILQSFIKWFNDQRLYSFEKGSSLRDFNGFTKMAIDKVFALYQMILIHYNKTTDWERTIIEYTSFVGDSFGEIPNQVNGILFKREVFEAVIELVSETDNITASDKDKISNILQNEIDHFEIRKSFEELHHTFNKWKSTLPSDLQFLGIKNKSFSFEELVVNSKPNINDFSGEPYHRLNSKSEMLEQLVHNTFSIFDDLKIESLELDDVEKTALTISSKTSKLEISKITKKYDLYELSYVDTIIQCLNIIENHIVKHKGTLELLKKEPKEKLNGKSNLMTIREVALFCVFSNTHVTRKNADRIVKQFQHTSGEKLFQYYTYYSSRANRTSPPHPNTKKKFENKLALFETVIARLAPENMDRAKDELNLLNIKFQDEHL